MLANRMIFVGGDWRKEWEWYVRHKSGWIFDIVDSTNE